VRAALYMASLAAVRSNPRFAAAYREGRSQGKPAKVALIAIARKLSVLANTLVKQDKLFDPDFAEPGDQKPASSP